VEVLRRLPESWAGLAGSLGGPTEERAWSQSAVEALGLDVRAVAVDGALAPLAAFDGRLEQAAAPLYEPVDLLWRDAPALDELARALARLRCPVLLRRLPADSPAIRALRRAFVRGYVVERPAGSCPVIEPRLGLSARLRSDLRRARRRAEALGAVEVELSASADALEEAFRVEAAGWKGRQGTALLDDPPRADFYRRYGRRAAVAGTLRVALLRIGDRPAAMQIAVERDGALWLLKIGYADEFARCSPGHLLLEQIVGLGLRVELLGTSASWTRAWTLQERACVTFAAYPANLASVRVLGRDALRRLRR
jgi:hypothetical protein